MDDFQIILAFSAAFIFFMLFIRYLINSDLNRAYRLKVTKVLQKAGFTKMISDRVSKTDQSTINKFVKLADVIAKQEENGEKN